MRMDKQGAMRQSWSKKRKWRAGGTGHSKKLVMWLEAHGLLPFYNVLPQIEQSTHSAQTERANGQRELRDIHAGYCR
jgi:hypothetical protein